MALLLLPAPKHSYKSLIYGILCVVSACAGLYVHYTYQQQATEIITTTTTQAQEQTANAARDLNALLEKVKPLVDTLAAKLSEQKLTEEQLQAELKKKPLEIFGFGVAFKPFGFDAKKKLFAPLYVEQKEGQKIVDVGTLYDYTQQQYDWYHRPQKEGAGFGKPYFNKASKTILSEYQAPFYTTDPATGKKEFAGVVYANKSVENLDHILSTLYRDETGYWFIMEADGTILTHPSINLTSSRASLYSVTKDLKPEFFNNPSAKPLTYVNEMTGDASWLFYEKLPATGWILCHVFIQKEMPFDAEFKRRSYINGSFALILLFLFLLLFGISFSKAATHVRLTAFLFAFALFAGLVATWYFAYNYPSFRTELETISSKVALYRYLDTIKDANKEIYQTSVPSLSPENPRPVATGTAEEQRLATMRYFLQYRYKGFYIPTGIFVKHIAAQSAKSVKIFCYIWQRYFDPYHKDLTRGFSMPQSTNTVINEIYRKKEGRTELVVWEVETELNQSFHHEQYPFDVQNIQIQLWHKDFESNVLLVPDLDSYSILNPLSLPGVNPEAYMSGLLLISSSFGYKKHSYATTFGLYNYGDFGVNKETSRSWKPELYFNISAQRNIFDYLFSDVIPLLCCLFILFVLIIITAATKQLDMNTIAATLFIILLAHIQFRDKMPTHQLVYFEFFYFISYFLICSIIFAMLTYTGFQKYWPSPEWLRYENFLGTKILFWPATLLMFLITTLVYLY